jgi:FdhD protein
MADYCDKIYEIVNQFIRMASIMTAQNRVTRVMKYQHSLGWQTSESHLVIEAESSLMVNGKEWIAFMCTPDHLEELAVGYLYNEGFIQSKEEIASIKVCGTDLVDIWLTHETSIPTTWKRTSGCAGGKIASIENKQLPVISSEFQALPDDIFTNVAQLLQAQEIYKETRGIHCSTLSDRSNILFAVEDIGRHNTFDKLAGWIINTGARPKFPVITTTGRISSEMLQKAVRLGCGTIISLTSPTSRSIDFAEQMGVMLVGYARRNSFSVYTHPERMDRIESG